MRNVKLPIPLLPIETMIYIKNKNPKTKTKINKYKFNKNVIYA